MTTLLLHHPTCVDHTPPEGHPERPDRIRAIDQILSSPHFDDLAREEAPMADRESVLMAHTPGHLQLIESIAPDEGLERIDEDTWMSPASLDVALRGVGAAMRAVDAVALRDADNAFCAMRPPGHHAESNRAMGFCFFNNAAIAAHHARDTYDLERIAGLQDGSNIAAVIVEPVAGSAGVLPPPVGYLERLREICDKHGILLIFDEVITAFGRVGKAFAAERFDVMPDIITTAKGLTNGVIPMGAVLVRDHVYEAFMQGPDYMIELFHGYTYSGHPVAAAAGLAAMDVYEEEGIFEQSQALEKPFEDLLHSFASHDKVIDVRNFGLMGAIEMAPRDGAPGARGLETHKRCFWDEKLMVRNGMDILSFSPFLNSKLDDWNQAFDSVRRVIDSID